MSEMGEALRLAMRHWTTGVSVVTGREGEHRHGMTVNSLTSVSLEPPCLVVTLANASRTCKLVLQSGFFAVTILSDLQQAVSDRFAGKVQGPEDRFMGIETFTLASEAPLLEGGLAHLDCRVLHTHPLGQSTLFIGEVIATRSSDRLNPLVYFNRAYHRLEP